MKLPNGEIIRGEVSIRKIYGAGGLSYVSSGFLVRGSHVGARWPEAVAEATSESTQINGIAAETVEDLISELRDCVSGVLDR